MGTVKSVAPERGGSTRIELKTFARIENGDGICFTDSRGEVLGTRVNVASQGFIEINDRLEIPPGTNIYRNFNRLFERELENNMPKRLIDVKVSVTASLDAIVANAVSEDGVSVSVKISGPFDVAKNRDRAEESIITQLSKSSGIYLFSAQLVDAGILPFLQVSLLNGIRRELAEKLEEAGEREWAKMLDNRVRPVREINEENFKKPLTGKRLSYLANSSNSLSEMLYKELGADSVERAFEIEPPAEAELMRCKYCIKFELGKCPAEGYRGKSDEPLYLENGGRRFRLGFDCGKCEMVIFG